MRITRIAATNFLAYKDLDIDLSDVSSVVVVGRNGHGKSTLLDVVTYALYGKGRFLPPRQGGSPDQQIRDGEDEMSATVAFASPQGYGVEVTRSKARGKTASVHVWVNDEEKTQAQHTNAETDDLIESLVGVPYDTLVAGPIMAQETSAALMNAQAADRLRLLVRLFEAEWCAPLHEDAKAIHVEAAAAAHAGAVRLAELVAATEGEAALRERLTIARNAHAALLERKSLGAEQMAQIREALAASQTRVSRHSELEAADQRLGQSIKANTAEADRLQSILDRAHAFLAADNRPTIVEPVPPDLRPLEDIRADLEAARAAETRQGRLQAEAEAADRDWKRAAEQRDTLGTVPCGGVGEFAACRFLTGVPAEGIVEAMRQNSVNLMLATGEAAVEAKRLPVLVMAERNLVAAQQTYEREHLLAQSAVEEHGRAQARAREVIEEQTPTVTRLREQVMADQAEHDRVDIERATIEGDFAAIVAKEAEQAEVQAVLADIDEKLSLVEPAVRAAEQRLAVMDQAKAEQVKTETKWLDDNARADLYKTLMAAFHPTGIPTLIIEQGIAQIEERANDLLARLPEDLRIELRTQRERKTGGTMDALDVVVTIDGWERDYAMLSVGQRFRVDLALRLGLGAVLTNRKGASIDTLWLDEPLADLDAEGREAAVEALNVLASDFGLIVVVSHHDEVNDRFPAVINVVKDGGVSTATLVS